RAAYIAVDQPVRIMSNPNAAIGRRWFEEMWNQRKENMVDELMTPDCVGHLEGRKVCGPAEFKEARRELLTVFPDIQFEIEAIVAAEEMTTVRWLAFATHGGDGMGTQATQRMVRFRGTTWLKCRHGKITEGWDTWNLGGLLDSLRPKSRPETATSPSTKASK